MNFKSPKRERTVTLQADLDAIAQAAEAGQPVPLVTVFKFLPQSTEFKERMAAQVAPYVSLFAGMAKKTGDDQQDDLTAAQRMAALPPEIISLTLNAAKEKVRECLRGWDHLYVDGVKTEPKFRADGRLDDESMDIIAPVINELALAIDNDSLVTVSDLKK